MSRGLQDQAIDIHDPRYLDSLSKEQLDELPCGTIRVDHEGTILFYSRAHAALTNREPGSVLGRNFFTEVAPCTVVPEFYGRFRRGVLTGTLSTSFEFVFDFDMEPVQVRITMRESDRPDEFWIVVEPLRKLAAYDRAAAEKLLAEKYGEQSIKLSAASFDFSSCDREPIATCANIQPFGALLVVDPATLRIDACSANTERFLGLTPEVLLDATLAEVLPADDPSGLLNRLTASDRAEVAPRSNFRLTWPNSEMPLDVRVQPWRDRILLECEPYGQMDADLRLEDFDVAAFQARLSACDAVGEVCQVAVDAFRWLSGFQRVVAYRFEPGDDGIVVAESLEPGVWPSIAGLRYPATDIPRQARALYLETPLRYAPSRDHADVPLLSSRLDPAGIDIGIAQLRAQSPIHRNYLSRFAVNGSMSLSVRHGRRLWGLIIFHHRKPHPVSAYARRRLIELAGCVTARLALIEECARNRDRELGMTKVNAILGEIDAEQPFPESFVGKEHLLLDLMDADLVQIYHRGRGFFLGQDCGLSEDELEGLLAFLLERPRPLWSTDCLSAEFEPAAAYPHRLAGVMVLFLGDQQQNLLIFGRKRIKHTVDWGANPTSLPFSGDDADRPFGWPNRKFEVWHEERTHHARPWSAVELATGEALKNLIQQVIVANAAHFERLAQSLAIQRDQLKHSREEMRRQALHDALTGLPNRVRFREVLLEMIEDSWRTGRRFGVALLDIDHFKTINDTLGHDKGDALLCAVAERIVAAMPDGVLVGRLGGDEFALLAPQRTEGDALDWMERLIAALRQPIRAEDDSFTITCSLGLAFGSSESEPGELLKQADLALYRAKEEGRNRLCTFDHSLAAQAMERLAIDRAVLGRSPTQAIEILLQPQLPIAATARQRRFEVLSRWRTADGELFMPDDFIPAAERNGLIRPTTVAVLRQAIRLLQTQLDQGEDDTLLAVNVSASDLESEGFARHLLGDLHAADVPPEMIEIEITESMLLRMTPRVKASLKRLYQGGVHLSLDDFGTGFSSLAYLRELPISHLKIDREFIRGIASPRDRNLVAGMIGMAHSIGKVIVAEGIETPEQLEILRTLGCDWGQGYLWSRPVPPEQALQSFRAPPAH